MRKLILVLLAMPMAASADIIRLEATSLRPLGLSDFTIIFDDAGDGLLQWEEIVEFSGVEAFFSGSFSDFVEAVPTIAGVSTSSWDPAMSNEPIGGWQFRGEGNTLTADIEVWSYNLASVPEPGTLALFGIGLLGMKLARRSRVQR